MNPGILFAFGALIGWSLGDFSIQKTVRAVGNVRALFYIAAAGGVLLLPFIWKEILPFFRNPSDFPLIIFTCLLVLGTALANFQGMKLGKLSVVLPINGVEVLIAILLAAAINKEVYPLHVYLIILAIVSGLLFTTIDSFKSLTKFKWESGVAWAFIGALGLGASNFFIGYSSRTLSPLFTVWITHTFIAFAALAIIWRRNELESMRLDLMKYPKIIIAQSVLDNLAWISYAYSAVMIPIGIATAISEGYLALGTLLGVTFNHEKLKKHQFLGISATILCVLLLAWITGQ